LLFDLLFVYSINFMLLVPFFLMQVTPSCCYQKNWLTQSEMWPRMLAFGSAGY
jgi:hypothetical protein